MNESFNYCIVVRVYMLFGCTVCSLLAVNQIAPWE